MDWVTSACALALLVLLGIVAVDRNRLRRRLDAADARVTGLELDLDATREQLARVQSYLGSHDSWQPDATAPAELRDQPHRWSAARPTVEGGGPVPSTASEQSQTGRNLAGGPG